jgi:hypothetical protein
MAEEVCLGLRNHKRRLQSMLQFEPHVILQDLYRLQSILQEIDVGPYPQTHQTHVSPTPVRYSADDAWEGNVSDDEELAEDMSANLTLNDNNKKQQRKPKGRNQKKKGRSAEKKF